MPTPNYTAYGATKAGILQLTRTLEQELEDSRVHVHMLSPGGFLGCASFTVFCLSGWLVKGRHPAADAHSGAGTRRQQGACAHALSRWVSGLCSIHSLVSIGLVFLGLGR